MGALTAVTLAATIGAYSLRVNALSEPLAIQGQPSFSWKLSALKPKARGLSQSAYRILVASSPALLKEDMGDLWDSGRIKSRETFGIRYQGKPLSSKSLYFWKLQVWDQDGVASAWSKAQSFGTELDARDRRAQWIAGTKPIAPPNALGEAQWIWVPDEAGDQTPAATHRFAYAFDPAGAEQVTLRLTVDDALVVSLNGKKLAETSGYEAWKKLTILDLTPHLQKGINSLEVAATNSSKSPAGLLAGLEFRTGTRVRHEFSGAAWKANGGPVKVLGKHGMAPWGVIGERRFVTAPAQYFRKPVSIEKRLTRATLYASVLGIADFTLNEKRVTEDLFTPGWTDYRKRVHYRAFDVTKQLKRGANMLGAVLGQGWYAGYVAWGAQREHYGDTPMLWMQLELEFADGSSETVITDGSWQVGQGSVLDEHFLHGETYDARLQPGHWQMATLGDPMIGPLQAFPGDPVREYQRLKPKSIRAIEGGKYILDFGQNLTGFVRLKASAPEGTQITLRHAERLDATGNVYTENLRLAQAIDRYTFSGEGTEEWNPRFTFHGFQYLEVSGLPEPPSADTFTAIAISSATPEVGTLKTSDPMLNKLVSNAWWTQKMNFVDVPTDCPQRDERLGWTGDAQAYIRTATYYSDVQAFFTKWLETLDDAQRADGQYPQVAPVLKGLEDGGPAWSDAGVICPVTIFQVYGDKALLARHYPQMKKFVEFCRTRSKPSLLPPDNYHLFGDWLSIKADTPRDVITTAYFAGSAGLVAEAAEALGLESDAAEYRELKAKIGAAFRSAYVDGEGRVQGDTQCGYVLALGFDLLTPDLAEKAAAHLVKNIEQRNWHLSTGFVGTRDLMDVLVKIDRVDVAYRLLHNKTFPSWGFPIVNGATSIWERWDGWTPERGFQDPGMNSFAHYAYGAVVGWMFKTLGGIDFVEPGFRVIRIAPKIDPELAWSECSYDSVNGVIRCKWSVSEGRLKLEVEVPVNTRAVVEVPRRDGGVESHQVGSGRWEFERGWR